jgi:tol-pal system-associated acyl-CoA thioesterase
MNQILPFTLPVRVYYEDTDAGGVVYHSQYLNFMERARTEWLRHLGFEQTELRDNLQVVFVVHSMQIEFKRPAKFNDVLQVKSEIAEVGRGSLVFMQQIMCGEALLVKAQIKVACVNIDSFKPTAVPDAMLKKIK